MTGRRSQSGQLILPILGILFLFGLFWIPYVLWCERTYWSMRMAATADLAALSAAREQARILNTTATLQTLQNALVTQVKGVGVASLSMKPQFEGLNKAMRLSEKSVQARAYSLLTLVARLNGSDRPVLPGMDHSKLSNLSTRLMPHSLKVIYVTPGAPPVIQTYPQGYFVRQWSPRIVNAQPNHESAWWVCRGTNCSEGRASLWLDVDPKSTLNNGGFPPPTTTWLRSVGFQCFYPQFNARLISKR